MRGVDRVTIRFPDLHNRNIRELFVDDKRNIILAVALTALILFGWPYVAEQFFPTLQPTQAPVSQNAPSSSSVTGHITETEIGRASCRERVDTYVWISGGA